MTTITTGLISSVASSIPLSIYFLGYLNYFTMCSLYVLLNFPIPEHAFNFLGSIYVHVNSDILSAFGVEINMPKLSD